METTKYYVAYAATTGGYTFCDKRVKVNRLIFKELLRCQVKEMTETTPEKFDETMKLVQDSVIERPLIVGNVHFEIKEQS